MNSFLIALQFLTVIPVPYTFVATDKQLGQSSLYYPMIGLLIGALLMGVSWLFAGVSVQIEAAIILMVWVLVTGALHLDGLADCADAWVGGLESKQRSLEIMKDPAAGPVAVVVLILVLLLKWSMMMEVLQQQRYEVLLLTPLLGRVAIVLLMFTTPYVRAGGLGEKLVQNLPLTTAKMEVLICLLIAGYVLAIQPLIFMLISLWVIAFQAHKRLGGVTGDVYGAVVELVEVSVLLGVLL